MKMIAIVVGIIVLVGLATVTAFVEVEASYRQEVLGGSGKVNALVLFRPSRDTHFSYGLSLAFADGLRVSGYVVQRANADTGYAQNVQSVRIGHSDQQYLVADTLRFLRRAQLDGVPAVGLIGGAGAAGRTQRMLDDALRKTEAKVLYPRSF